MFLEKQISILEWFLKDHVTLKKSNDAEKSALHHMNKLHFKIYWNQKQLFKIVKGSYDVAKKNIILCIWCNAMCLCGFRFKKHILFHILYIIVAPLCSTFLKRADFYKAHRSKKWGMQWLASYPVRCNWQNTSSVRRKCSTDDTKINKPIRNETFAASSGNIMTDYNDLYCFFTRCIALHKHYHICICDRSSKHYSTLLKTRIRIVSSRNVLTGCESEASDLQNWNCPTL